MDMAAGDLSTCRAYGAGRTNSKRGFQTVCQLLIRIDEAKAARPALHQINRDEILTAVGRRKSCRGPVPTIVMVGRQEFTGFIINVDRNFPGRISGADSKPILIPSG